MKKNLISLLALILSLIACVITWLRIEIYITNDTFIGIIAGFMGVCTTMIVGLQIYNSIDYKNKIQLIEETQRKLAIELSEAQIDRKRSEMIIQSNIYKTNGLSLISIQPFTAYAAFYKSLEYALKAEEPECINAAMNDLLSLKSKIKLIPKDKMNQRRDMDEILELKPDNLKVYPPFKYINQTYCEVYYEICSYIRTLKIDN